MTPTQTQTRTDPEEHHQSPPQARPTSAQYHADCIEAVEHQREAQTTVLTPQDIVACCVAVAIGYDLVAV